MTIFPVTAESVTPPQNSPCLEYKMYLFHPGAVEVEAIVAPTLNFVPGRGLRCAVSFDDQPPQIIPIVAKDYVVAYSNNDWQEAVRNSVRTVRSTHTLSERGYHTLKVWMVDPGVVLEKLVVNTGGVKPSYLGPPESYRGGLVSSKRLLHCNGCFHIQAPQYRNQNLSTFWLVKSEAEDWNIISSFPYPLPLSSWYFSLLFLDIRTYCTFSFPFKF
jgi:hypothetical protein